MLEFIKSRFFTGLVFLSTLTSVNLRAIKNAKQGHKLSMLMEVIPAVLKQVNAVVVATISIILSQNCVYLVL